MARGSIVYGVGFALWAAPGLALSPPMSCTVTEMCSGTDCQAIDFAFNVFPDGDRLAFGNQNGDAATVQVHPDAPEGVQVLTLVEPGVDAFLLVIQDDGSFQVVGLELEASPRGPLVGSGQCTADG